MDAMDNLNALLVQAQLRWKCPARNREHLGELLAGAEPGFDLAVLPETFTTGFLGDADLPSEDMNGETVAWMKTLAERHGSAIAGSVVIETGGHRYNRLLFVTPEGEVSHYDKRHLFAYGGENHRYTAGAGRVIVDYLGWRINLQVCYDLRFPAWCRNRNDYDLMLLVANWPSRRVAHWSALLKARAIENQSWVIGVNRVGEDGNGFKYPGCSVVHDPLGECIADLGAEERMESVNLDIEMLRKFRKDFPFQVDADNFELL
jgi:predicted amidohydrolase